MTEIKTVADPFELSWKELKDASEITGKTIRAQGVISLYNGAKQLIIDSPDKWQIVEGAK